ncbi:PIN domain-containing protein [Ideonella sp.]|uniref:PIN domain-containing protein n=1 Tax=Ideonella sp. TaxID=1929293 RepID=UPI0037BE2772
MAGPARYTALLDACVLFPVAVCDSLLTLAATGLFAAKWTERIETEWMAALATQTRRSAADYGPRRDAMRDAVPDWEVPTSAWQTLAGGLFLPDPNDVHVLAAAIAGHADCIVTANLKDFPSDCLAPWGLTAIHPDDFIVAQIDLAPLLTVAAFKAQRARLRRPSFTPEDFASALERNGLVQTAQRLREAAALI